MNLDDKETVQEEPTIQELVDACRGVLDEETCDEIAEQENFEDALGLAFTALEEAGENPEEFLKEKGILE